MTNREWLLNKMQNMYVEELAGMVQIRCEMGCYFCDKKDKTCYECKLEWLKSEHKEPITLSEAERIVLESINKDYKWICRDKGGNMHVFKTKPIKHHTYWDIGSSYSLCAFNHLFQFIKWEDKEAYNIEELLKGE